MTTPSLRVTIRGRRHWHVITKSDVADSEVVQSVATV